VLCVPIIHGDGDSVDSKPTLLEKIEDFLAVSKGIRPGARWVYGTHGTDEGNDQPRNSPQEGLVYGAN
jgi:hypothetical protein